MTEKNKNVFSNFFTKILTRKNPDEMELSKIFEELEFKTLAKKILGTGSNNPISQESNLFSEDIKNVNVNKSKKRK